jgi:hypothetical protein
VANSVRFSGNPDPSTSGVVPSNSTNRSAPVPAVAGTFSPQRPLLRLDNHGYSPALFQQIVELAGQLRSFQQAALALRVLTQLDISGRQSGRLTQEIGVELAKARDAKVIQHRRRQLQPQVQTVPDVVAVEVDGGRLETRQPGQGPGVHQAQNKEDKIACLVSLSSTVSTEDPQPQPPPAFVDPPRVARLVRQMQGQAAQATPEPNTPLEQAAACATTTLCEPWQGSPKKLVRTCVASMQNSRAFGPMMAAEAQSRNFYKARRRAFLGDGSAYNWTIQRGYFRDFEPIVDFLHVLCYVYLAAWAVGGEDGQRWSLYLDWLRACWQGRVGEVIEQLRLWQERLGPLREGGPPEENAVREQVKKSLGYLRNNQKRMAYPRYRRAGLPVTSSLVESLVGEFNARVKGKDKYWNRPEGAEAILQVRAALLSEDDRLARHFANRPGNPYRRRQVS